MHVLLLGHYITKNILQHQLFVESLAELSEPTRIPLPIYVTILQPHFNEAANNSEHQH